MQGRWYCGIVLTALGPILNATPTAADAPRPESTLAVNYSIAFWAIPFGHTHYDGTLDANSYSAKVHFQTSGMVSAFWNFVIDAAASGKIAAHSIAPAVYDSYSQDRSKPTQRVKVTFDKDEPVTFADPPYDMSTYPVTEEQKAGTLDPMSAITSVLSGVKADTKNPCGTGVQVFDGRRRYDIVFTYLKDEPVKLGNGVFSGSAHLCQIHFNYIAGYKQKIIREGKQLPEMFADFADIPASGAPGGRFVVAVKLWSPLSLGTVTVTLDDVKIDGSTPQSADSHS
jgi:hypothetical protein